MNSGLSLGSHRTAGRGEAPCCPGGLVGVCGTRSGLPHLAGLWDYSLSPELDEMVRRSAERASAPGRLPAPSRQAEPATHRGGKGLSSERLTQSLKRGRRAQCRGEVGTAIQGRGKSPPPGLLLLSTLRRVRDDCQGEVTLTGKCKGERQSTRRSRSGRESGGPLQIVGPHATAFAPGPVDVNESRRVCAAGTE